MRCDYCGYEFEEQTDKCPFCGQPVHFSARQNEQRKKPSGVYYQRPSENRGPQKAPDDSAADSCDIFECDGDKMEKNRDEAMEKTALFLGIAALISSFTASFFITLPLAIAGIVCSRKCKGVQAAKTIGLVTSIISIVITVITVASTAAAIMSFDALPEFMEDFDFHTEILDNRNLSPITDSTIII